MAEKYYSISPYAYCLNNPLKYIDPDGRSSVLTLPVRVVKNGRNMYRAAKAFLFGSSVAAGAGAYNHYLSQEQAQQAQEGFLNTVTERAAEIKAQEVTSELNKNLPPDPGWVRGQGKAAEAWGEAQKMTHTEMVNNNAPDGSGDNKGGKIKTVVGGAAVIVGGAARIIMEGTNPDASKDAAVAHQEKVEEKQKQVPQDPPRNPSLMERFVKWLNE